MGAGQASTSDPGHPPGAWPIARDLFRSARRPIDRFLQIEASSGIVLMLITMTALVWANSPWSETYERLLEMPIEIRVGSFVFAQNLHFVVNEVLMTLFFFVVGLEIRREVQHGELSELRRAALPIAAAAGGMIAPAVIYFMWNGGTSAQRGWGVPMATDIAFAVAVLSLLGRRVPAALRVLLLTLAIADDIGAVLVIAFFYSNGVQLEGFLWLGIGVASVLALQKLGVRAVAAYVLPGLLVWQGFHAAEIHPTLAGVMVGLLTPATPWLGVSGLARVAGAAIERVAQMAAGGASAEMLWAPLRDIELARREALSPADRLIFALHPWVAWVVMPTFALANAGVRLEDVTLAAAVPRAALGIVFGLVVGKPIGVLAASALVVRLGWAVLPRGVTWSGIAVVGMAAGIGFTMAVFIANLAFGPDLLGAAKLAILGASVLSGLAAWAAGSVLLRHRDPVPGEVQGAADAEASNVGWPSRRDVSADASTRRGPVKQRP